MNKNFSMVKGCEGNVSDGNASFGNHSRIDPKCSHDWFIDGAEPQLFPSKKQAVQVPNGECGPGVCHSSLPWENNSSFQSVPNQFIGQLFGSDNAGRKEIGGHFGENAAVGLSISHATEDPKASFGYGGIKKVKVNHVRDSHIAMFSEKDRNLSNKGISTLDVFDRENESSFISLNQGYDKESENITLMGHTYNKLDPGVRPMAPSYSKDDEIPIPMGIAHSKEVANLFSFDRCHEENGIMDTGRPIGTYEAAAYSQYSDKKLEATSEKQFDLLNSQQDASAARLPKSKPDSVSRSKSEIKSTKKEAPNCFPSNVRTLISTGMLDGVPVKYVSLSREELRGIIKGSGYLCGCESCNYSKVLNAYEFERHANCKTKHPNSHIYFENGKTIYQIVQELKNTPQDMLFDTIQTVFGAPINQKSFRSWKESYQAATRELQRIYGRDDLTNL